MVSHPSKPDGWGSPHFSAILPAKGWASPQSWNRYAYVTNNPMAMVDPFGDQEACYDAFGSLSAACGSPGGYGPSVWTSGGGPSGLMNQGGSPGYVPGSWLASGEQQYLSTQVPWFKVSNGHLILLFSYQIDSLTALASSDCQDDCTDVGTVSLIVHGSTDLGAVGGATNNGPDPSNQAADVMPTLVCGVAGCQPVSGNLLNSRTLSISPHVTNLASRWQAMPWLLL